MAAGSGLRVDPLLSYACRAGGSVRVVLEITGAAPAGDAGVALRLIGGGDAVDVPATVTPSGTGRFRVEAEVAAGLGGHVHRMRLLDASSAEPRNLQTRLLVRADLPVALLPGRAPDTRLPEPSPRPASSRTRARRGRAGRVPVVGRLRRRGRAGA